MALRLAQRAALAIMFNTLFLVILTPESGSGWASVIVTNLAFVVATIAWRLAPRGRVSPVLFGAPLTLVANGFFLVEGLITTVLLAAPGLEDASDNSAKLAVGLNIIVFGAFAATYFSVAAVGERVGANVERQAAQVSFLRAASTKADRLADAGSPELKKFTSSVSEALRYSPVQSVAAVRDTEQLITQALDAAATDLDLDDEASAIAKLRKVEQLVKDRADTIRLTQ